MNAKNCEACQALGKKNSGQYLDEIYHSHGAPTSIRLCYGHSVELFKFGQKTFISKYRTDVPERMGRVRNSYDPLQSYFISNSIR